MKNADMPAAPFVLPQGVVAQPYVGLTKREMMAMHLHAALLTATDERGHWSAGFSTCECCVVRQRACELAVEEADALLAELERTK
ncbi:hypothetical protein ACR2VJ_27065 [Klebsiella pneumoniae]